MNCTFCREFYDYKELQHVELPPPPCLKISKQKFSKEKKNHLAKTI